MYAKQRKRRPIPGRGKAGLPSVYSAEASRLRKKFDDDRGVDTGSNLPRNSLDIGNHSKLFAERYEPSPESTFHSVLRQLNIDFRSYTFFDFGAGKGKSLFMAAEYPFKKIIGVELAVNVYQIAKRNIQTFSSDKQRCFDLEIRHGDALDVDFPSGNTIFFLFAPFYGKVLKRVLSRIEKSIRSEPRELVLIWIDEDVHYSMTKRVARIVDSWGTMKVVKIDLHQHDPEIQRPFTGTFWSSQLKAPRVDAALEPDKLIAIAPGYLFEQSGGNGVVVDSKSGRQVLTINETGTLILSHFLEARRPRDVSDSMARLFGQDPDSMYNEVITFLESLKEHGLLEGHE